MCCVASAIEDIQQHLLDEVFVKLRSARSGALVISRHFDPTPVRVRFGRLQSELEPHARYLVPDASGKRYRQVGLQEFKDHIIRGKIPTRTDHFLPTRSN
jgi:hypothetical protein